MKPQGRKYFNNKTGSKHFVKIDGKTYTWWEDVCTPNKIHERQASKKEIQKELKEIK